MKKIYRYFSLIIISAILLLFFSNNSASAMYDRDKNQVSVSVSKDSISITVKYQRGFDKDTAMYVWCRVEPGATPPEESCVKDEFPKYADNNYVSASGKDSLSFIPEGDASHVDYNTTTHTFTVSKDDDPILSKIGELTDGTQPSVTYVVFVVANFCAVRGVAGEDVTGSCTYFDDPKIVKVDVNLSDLKNDGRVDIGDISDSGLQSMMEKISDIVYTIVMPIIWAILGLFLVVKGTILGVQIVKSADEPQIRQEKIGSLKWLVIGVAIAALAAGVVQVLTGFFGGALKF